MQTAVHTHADDYDAFVQRINDRFNALTGPIFETDATGLYDAYLIAFADPADRQYHTCSCCRQFIERFGALATVDDAGMLVPIWNEDDAPEHYKPAVAAMARRVRRAAIIMPFLSSETMYGTPVSGERKDGGGLWHHFAVRPAAARVFRSTGLKTAFQAASEKREEFGTVGMALGEYSADTCKTALRLLQDDQLGNSAAALGQAQFLVDLHQIRAGAKGTAAKNLMWRTVATAPAGLCHPRSSMISTLLDDIAAGKSFEQARASWNRKIHPLSYQRPQAAPTAGNIAQAEKIFAELGLAAALKRRIARIEEVPKLWEPRHKASAPSAGLFGHLSPKTDFKSTVMEAPAIAITLDKFARTVVPTAEKIEVHLGYNAHFITLTTEAEADAPKLFQWNHPFAWYVWAGGSSPSQYGLSSGWSEVAGITRLPARWNDEQDGKFEHQGDGIILLLDGARESRVAGSALFPALLRSELREVRATIERYSAGAEMTGLRDGTAIGIDMRKGSAGHFPVTVRVTSDGRTQQYKIDRWD